MVRGIAETEASSRQAFRLAEQVEYGGNP